MRTTVKQTILNIAAFAVLLIPMVVFFSGEGKRRVAYFAMQYNFEDISYSSVSSTENELHCSMEVVVANTRESIISLRTMDQMYSVILFGKNATSTSPTGWEETISFLNSLKGRESNSLYNQVSNIGQKMRNRNFAQNENRDLFALPYSTQRRRTTLHSAMEEFLAQKKEDDILVYYIPCNFDYTQETQDVVRFVREMKNFGVEHQVLIVSYTHSVDVVSALYGKHQHVIGVENANYAVDLIVEFVKGKHGSTTKLPPLKTTPQSTISKLPDSSTTTSDYVLSTESSTQETTVKLSTSHLPELTTSESTQMSPVSHTRPASTSATEATTQIADLSTTPETSHSSKIVTTSAIESTAQMKTSTKPEDSGAHCLFAADLFNFGRRGIASEKVLEEKNSLLRIAELLLNNVTTSSVGLWVYGYVRKQYKWRDVFNKMTSNYLEFWIDASDKMQLGNLLVPVDNDAVIDTLNRAYDGRTKWRSNCMVFLTGMKNVTETKLQPWKNFRKTVVISLQGTDLSSITDERATVLNMSLPLSDTDVAVVLHSIIDDY